MSNKPYISVLQVYSAYDPTRTTTLRNAFARDLRKRFRNLRGAIRTAIVQQDVFGLKDPSDVLTQQMTTPEHRAFAFNRSSDKIQAFMDWLRSQVDEGLLETVRMQQAGQAIEGAWTNIYIKDAYQRGVIRARQEMRNAGINVPAMEQTGGLQVAMGTPFHADRVGLLYARTYNELKGITEAMGQQISRVLAQGMADGDGPSTIARKLNATIEGSGAKLGLEDSLGRYIPARRRAEIMARTEIIRAHHQATIQEYKNWGAKGVSVKAEWSTAGDERVCPYCAGMESETFNLDEAMNIIPAHAQCRCIALPLKQETQRQITSNIAKDPVASGFKSKIHAQQHLSQCSCQLTK
jgi:SPP1 gp7 family putative phage head morphogenesis protein